MEKPYTASDAREVDWMDYEPPEALSKLPDAIPEPIIAVVQSALENVRHQIEAEKARAARQTTGRAADDDGSGHEDGQPGSATAASDTSHHLLLPLSRLGRRRGRSCFGISRILRYVVEKDELREERNTPTGRASGASHDMPLPTLFTQFVYKYIKAPSLERAGGPIECVSCLEDISPRDCIKTVCHSYCKECFQRLVETAIENEAQWPPKCCLSPIPYRTITKHIRGDLLRAYGEKREEYMVAPESRIYCSEPDCGAWIREQHINRATKTGLCPRGHVICTTCRQGAHPGNAACPQDRDQQMANRLADEEGWRRCYKCSVLVEHTDACQHMTCRCGAQFCYVCGARWRTCACGIGQLLDLKNRAGARRAARTANEAAEARGRRDALRRVEQFEAEEARRAEVRRREEAVERAEREEMRLAMLAGRRAELRIALAELNDTQRAELARAQDAERRGAAARADAERRRLVGEQEQERADRMAAAAARIADRELEMDGDRRARAVWEMRLEGEYEAMLAEFWTGKRDGTQRARAAMREYVKKNEARMDSWKRWTAGELDKFRLVQENELAAWEELMDNAKQLLDETLLAEESELERKQRADLTWFMRVTRERARLLFQLESAENGRGVGSGTQTGSSDDGEDLLFVNY